MYIHTYTYTYTYIHTGERPQALRLTEKGESLEPLEKVRAEFQAAQ